MGHARKAQSVSVSGMGAAEGILEMQIRASSRKNNLPRVSWFRNFNILATFQICI